MKKYKNKKTREIVKAFKVTKDDIQSIQLSGHDTELKKGDYIIVREKIENGKKITLFFECMKSKFKRDYEEVKK